MGKKCSMLFCERDVSYVKLGVCRKCYNRIWWIHRHYDKSLEDAKKSLIKIDKAVEAQGLTDTQRVFQYSSRKRSKKNV